MQIRIFSVPAWGNEAEEESLNKFLRGHRILQVEKQFIADGVNSHWCFCVEYLEGSEPIKRAGNKAARIDYREVLPPEAFARFARYREIRKTLAERDGVPPYAVFTDKELAEMAEVGLLTPAEIRSIEGVGEKKLAKYGEHFITKAEDETER
ncbi:HRDC domain-containing protein [Neolewinella lacunae]|uniref:HRDC domain-containing protein n=1 Tax=Neolewinella lacunae TaxID=1517758 RepID=A0A923PQD5_9BACT|nr:HRDC domain-containing protein [Neolewinella lacunae]MBC6995554.1 HRDC domain-containing protein [Neolewinella lacunae]MDN3635590.1 HRDC domain-containing protein [Neolewinella lacunae]